MINLQVSGIIQEISNRLRDPDETTYVDWTTVIDPNLNGRARDVFIYMLDSIVSQSVRKTQRIQALKYSGLPIDKQREAIELIDLDFEMASDYSGLVTYRSFDIEYPDGTKNMLNGIIPGMLVKLLSVNKSAINFSDPPGAEYDIDFELKQIIKDQFNTNFLDYARDSEVFWGMFEDMPTTDSTQNNQSVSFYNIQDNLKRAITFNVCREVDLVDIAGVGGTLIYIVTNAGVSTLTGSSSLLNVDNFPVGSKIKIKFTDSDPDSGTFIVTASTAGTVTYNNALGTTGLESTGIGGYLYSGYYPTLDLSSFFSYSLIEKVIDLSVNKLKQENLADIGTLQNA